MKFTVDRKTWYRGKGYLESALLREDGTRCCIGFVGKQCGIADSHLLGTSVAAQVPVGRQRFPEWLQMNTDDSNVAEAYATNDSSNIEDWKRELLLKKIFARNGDAIEFIG